MDVTRFDAMTKAWTLAPRRRVLGGLVGVSLATALHLVGIREAGATHFGCLDVGARCHSGGQCCSGRCNKHHRCRAHNVGICKAGQDACVLGSFTSCGANGASDCFCFITTGGASFCGSGTTPSTCTHDKECEATAGKGAACVSCSNAGGNVCVARCPKPD